VIMAPSTNVQTYLITARTKEWCGTLQNVPSVGLQEHDQNFTSFCESCSYCCLQPAECTIFNITVIAIHLQMLLTGTCQLCGSLSAVVHTHVLFCSVQGGGHQPGFIAPPVLRPHRWVQCTALGPGESVEWMRARFVQSY